MPNPPKPFPISFLSVLFFMSGMAGLVYQVAWQRVLFSAFGADIESVTIVVSAFMLGLGLGALGGGYWADKLEKKRLYLFAGCEAVIGIYGVFSPWLLRAAGDLFVNSTLPIISGVNFMLILIPTFFMGATLPLLVSYVATVWTNVGRATGHLYALNTLGAGLGSIGAGFVFFNWATLDQAIYLSAVVNFTVAAIAVFFLRKKS